MTGSAQAAPLAGSSAMTASASAGVLEKVDYYADGHNYCWYYDGWHGPGWYWCGYAWRRGFGWGSPVWGWRGWAWGGPRYRGGFRGGPGRYNGGHHH